jgi:hypothetical protein
MGSYGVAERWAARCLYRFPRAHRLAKYLYQRANYLVCRKAGVRCILHPRVRMITPMAWARVPTSDGEWFFGYYDKSPWTPAMDRALFHRPAGTQLDILLVDRTRSEIRGLGATRSWNLQQGSQTQWLPGHGSRIAVFNDRIGDQLGCRIVNVDDGTQRTIPWPIQTLHPNGREALTLNYARLHALHSEYGYPIPARNFAPDLPPDQDGIWHIDLEAGAGQLVLSLATLMRNVPRPDMTDAQHKVNHLIYSPAGARFVFMHRWIGTRGKSSRLYVAQADGGRLRLLMDHGMVSHYHWRDDEWIVVWGRTADAGDRYYLMNVVSGERTVIGQDDLDRFGDGHPSYSPNRRWIVTDTYPDRSRLRHLFVFDTDANTCTEIGVFFAPWAFNGAARCDLHPRWSADGRWISIDSAHEGQRRSYFLDVSAIVGAG